MIIERKDRTIKTILGKGHFLLNIPVFLVPIPQSCSLCSIRETDATTPLTQHASSLPRQALNTMVSILPHVDGGGGGRFDLILNRAAASPEMSSGQEPSIKDINKLQVFRNLPATLWNRKRILSAVLLTLNREPTIKVWGSLAAETTNLGADSEGMRLRGHLRSQGPLKGESLDNPSICRGREGL